MADEVLGLLAAQALDHRVVGLALDAAVPGVVVVAAVPVALAGCASLCFAL